MTSASADTAAKEFIYSCAIGTDGRARLVKHRIFKRTSTRIYATREPRRDEPWQAGSMMRTFVLDRRELESEKGAWNRVTRARYFVRPELALGPLHDQEPSPALVALGLRSGAGLLAIRQAYHRRALRCHPDIGGDAAAFRTLHAHYEAACREVEG